MSVVKVRNSTNDGWVDFSVAGTHPALTLGGGSDPTLTLDAVNQILTLATVMTPTSHLAIGDGAPHHPRSHDLLSALDHTATGLVAGHVLRATGATTFAFQGLQAADLPDLSATYALAARQITAGLGLTGGGDLTADRSFAVVAGSGIDLSSGVGLAWGTPTISSIVPDVASNAGAGSNPTRSDHVHGIVTAAPGGTGNSPSVNVTTNSLGALTSFARSDHTHLLDQGIVPVWTGSHTFHATMTTYAIQPAAPDAYDLGSSANRWNNIWASTIQSFVLAKNTISVMGGDFLICKGQGVLPGNVVIADTTIDFGMAMTVGDFVKMQSIGQAETIQVGALSAGTVYNVTRAVSGGSIWDWAQGTPFAVLGQNGNGYIDLNAASTPRISVFKQGATYLATEVVRLGDLNTLADYGVETYGLFMGNYAANKWLSADPVNGLRIRGDAIISGTVTAAALNVTSLSSISANLGTITAGTITGATIQTVTSGARIAINSAGNYMNLTMVGVACPTNLTGYSDPQLGGGGMADGTYYYVVTAITANGETVQSSQSVSIIVYACYDHGAITLNWKGVPGATGYKIYRSTSSGVYTTPSYIATTAAGVTTYWDSAPFPSAGAPPVSDTGANTTVVEYARFGDLKGIADYVTDKYGLFVGDYANKVYLSCDATNGLRVTGDAIFGNIVGAEIVTYGLQNGLPNVRIGHSGIQLTDIMTNPDSVIRFSDGSYAPPAGTWPPIAGGGQAFAEIYFSYGPNICLVLDAKMGGPIAPDPHKTISYNGIFVGYEAINVGPNWYPVGATAYFHAGAGRAEAGLAPFKFTPGTNLYTPESGAVEWDGTNLFITQGSGPTRKTFAYTDSSIRGAFWYPLSDSTTALQIRKADGTTPIVVFDTTNKRVGIGGTPSRAFEVIADGGPAYIAATAYGISTSAADILFQKAQGSLASPTGVLSGDYIGQLLIGGWLTHHDGTAGAWEGARGFCRIIASENWWSDAPIDGGFVLQFSNRPNGTVGGLLERMRIDQSGYVGIGTPAPGYLLEVNGSIRVSSGSGGGIVFADGTTMTTAAATATGMTSTTDVNFGSDTDNNGSGNLIFSSSTAERMRIIPTTGYIGIGLTVPLGVLHIAGTGVPVFYLDNYAANNAGMTIRLRHSRGATVGSNAATVDADALGYVSFQGNSGAGFTNGAYIGGYQEGAAGTFTPARLTFFTSDGTNQWLERMRISSLGYVGINTTPAGRLHIADTALLSCYIDQYSATPANSAQIFFRKSAGASVGDTATADTESLGNVNFYGDSGAGFTRGGRIGAVQVGAAGTYTPTALIFWTSDGTNTWAERVRIGPTGLVGVGTTVPDSLLTLNSNAVALPAAYAGTMLHIGQADGAAPVILMDSFGTVTSTIIGRRARNTNAGPLNSVAGNSLFSLCCAGYGATGYSLIRGYITFYAAESWTDSAQGTYIAFQTTLAGGITTNEKMRITDAGSVGIGTTAPNAKLSVSLNAANLPAGLTGTMVQVGQADATNLFLMLDTFSGSANIAGRQATTPASSPSALMADRAILNLSAFGYGATGYCTGARAQISLETAEGWTDSAQGTYIKFSTTQKLTASALERFRIADNGDLTQTVQQNGSALAIKTLTELTTIAAAAYTDTAIQIPAGAIALAVDVRVVTVIPIATTFNVGVPGATNMFATGVSTAANTTNKGTISPALSSTTQSIRFTMVGGTPNAATGQVRVTIHYIDITPATS